MKKLNIHHFSLLLILKLKIAFCQRTSNSKTNFKFFKFLRNSCIKIYWAVFQNYFFSWKFHEAARRLYKFGKQNKYTYIKKGNLKLINWVFSNKYIAEPFTGTYSKRYGHVFYYYNCLPYKQIESSITFIEQYETLCHHVSHFSSLLYLVKKIYFLDHKDRISQTLKSPPMLFHLFNYFFCVTGLCNLQFVVLKTKVQCNVLVKHKKCVSWRYMPLPPQNIKYIFFFNCIYLFYYFTD